MVRVQDLERTGDGGPLRQYRVYFLDGDGRVASAPYEFEADSDETAVKVAEAWREGRRIELWCRARKIRLPDEM